MGSKPKAPKTPDYRSLAKQEIKARRDAHALATTVNRFTDVNPWSQSGWTKDAATNQWTRSTTLHPELQRALNAQMGLQGDLSELGVGMLGRVEQSMQDPYDFSGAPEAGKAGFGAIQEVQDAMMSRMRPDLDARRKQQEAQMIAQGIGGNTGGEAWDRQQALIGRNENDAYQQALMGAMDQYHNQFTRQNMARNQYINEMNMLRDRPMNEMLGVLGAAGEVRTPVHQNLYTQGAHDASGMANAAQMQYGADMDKYNAAMQSRGNTLGTIGTVAGTVMGGPVGGMIGGAAGRLLSK